MTVPLHKSDGFGLVHPASDAHTLGIMSVAQLLRDCGCRVEVADAAVCAALDRGATAAAFDAVAAWLIRHGITVLGVSYRLDPAQGEETFGRLLAGLRERALLGDQGGPLRALYFAGLPDTCERVRRRFPAVAGCFCGDETPAETLAGLGVPAMVLPAEVAHGAAYDEARLAFGRDLLRRGADRAVQPVAARDYPEFGTAADTLVARLRHARRHELPPLMRAHVGPFLPDREAAVRLFLEWTRRLAASGYLDVLSVGSSQLTQAAFGQDWNGRPDGGGVPLNSVAELAAVWEAARPMLVRIYAGTRDVPRLARLHEEHLHIAWHALSLWWFCRIDGRGPNGVLDNLREHAAALRYIASTGKPYEANVAHHFSFRGADDATSLAATVLAARFAKALGIRHFVLQVMLNTPKSTWGVQDLAKARVALRLVRELEDDRFQVILQPRGGLDYFSHQPDKARAQLAAVTALMDDIEPREPLSPPVIHVVSYSEGRALADPDIVDESIRITRAALAAYRELRRRGEIDDMTDHPAVRERCAALLAEVRGLLDAIAREVPRPLSPEGLHDVFARGFLPVPYLWECRDEFRGAIAWQTRTLNGAVRLVDEHGNPLSLAARLQRLAAVVRPQSSARKGRAGASRRTLLG
jgi:hypothetical protein